jgi:phospholipid/cholesterol/gamma-HCH transport system substrate-binding protein
MDEKILRFRVGVVVLAAMIIGVVLIVLVGDLPNPFSSKKVIHIHFASAPGVAAGTPIRKSGILIGRVKKVELLRNGTVMVDAEIDGNRPVYEYEKVRVGTASLLGDGIVEFVQAPAAPKEDQGPDLGEELVDGDTIEDGAVAPGPMDSMMNMQDDVEKTLQMFQRVGDKIEALTDNVNSVLGDNSDRIPRIMQKTEKALDQFNDTMNKLNESIETANIAMNDPEFRESMTKMIRDIPDTFQELREAIAQTKKTLQGADEAMASMGDIFDTIEAVGQRAEANLANLEKVTKPLADRGPELVEDFFGTMDKADRLVDNLIELTENINSSQGSFNKFIKDPELYDRAMDIMGRVERTTANIEEITKKALPIVDDARVMVDKLARDPRYLGVKGALDRTPLGTGNKYVPDDYGDEPPTMKYWERARARSISHPMDEEEIIVMPSARASGSRAKVKR